MYLVIAKVEFSFQKYIIGMYETLEKAEDRQIEYCKNDINVKNKKGMLIISGTSEKGEKVTTYVVKMDQNYGYLVVAKVALSFQTYIIGMYEFLEEVKNRQMEYCKYDKFVQNQNGLLIVSGTSEKEERVITYSIKMEQRYGSCEVSII